MWSVLTRLQTPDSRSTWTLRGTYLLGPSESTCVKYTLACERREWAMHNKFFDHHELVQSVGDHCLCTSGYMKPHHQLKSIQAELQRSCAPQHRRGHAPLRASSRTSLQLGSLPMILFYINNPEPRQRARSMNSPARPTSTNWKSGQR